MKALAVLSLLAPLTLFFGGCSGTTPIPASNESAVESARLTVRFEGIAAIEGELVCALYADATSFESNGSPFQSSFLPVVGETVKWGLDLPFGSYGIKVYHDLNGNRDLDRKAFGIPAEPYGFSNDARGSFGPPSWEAARFEVKESKTELTIQLR